MADLFLTAIILLAAFVTLVIVSHRVVQANAARRDREFYEALQQRRRDEPATPPAKRPVRSRRRSAMTET